VWGEILRRRRPTGLVLTRQNLPTLDRASLAPASGAARGGYVLAEASGGTPAVLLLATGSEVQLALAARETLEADGVPARVVSLPCLEWFEEQDAEYRESVLPSSVAARVSVEAGIAQGWWKHLGTHGRAVSLEHFGASASFEKLFAEFGITADAVVAAARESIAAASA
jgi:transketolase